ncbi:hypothetical protein KY284_001476 [Solanum tuberosum]|nr:hypothetical protein KY284_001476 [Solanum tuberosum]
MTSSSFSASNSQYCPRWKYGVFLSFRGEDTRKNFTSHLYQSLENKGIFTFLDDKRLEDGYSISEKLVKAIEESQVAVIVFSKNYATSRWCLNELVKIMECKEKEIGHTVIPVFCYVDPSHVRYQSESFAEAFAKHESRYKDDVEGMQKVQGWRNALAAAANLKDMISVTDTHLEKVKSLLEMEFNDVRMVGIWGIGGVGKTTIARAIFDTNSNRFDGACFLTDIKENKCGMHSLQNILLSELLTIKGNHVNNKEDGKHMIAHRLRSKKITVTLAGDLDWFGKGSRIIATTRDKHLLGKNDVVYEVTTLLDHDAIKLFHQYAFKEEVPGECFEKLSLEMHDLIQDMGKYIVNMQKDPGERSRLWEVKDLKEVLVNNTGTVAVEVIWYIYIRNLWFSKDAMKNMKRLRILYISDYASHEWLQGYNFGSDSEVNVSHDSYDSNWHDGFIEYLPNNLRWLTWYHYPWKSLPENFKPQRLVHLDLQHSLLHELWTKRKIHLPSLRRLDLQYSRSLMETPDFTGMPNLEYLDLSECESLKEIRPSLRCSRKLISLELSGCINLERFPCLNVESLEILCLMDCFSLEKFPEILGRLKPKLDISVGGSEIRSGWPTVLDLSDFLDLRYCNLTDGGLPEDIGCLSSLKELHLQGNNFEHLPLSIAQLGSLRSLDLSECRRLKKFLGVNVAEGLRSLENLNLSSCNLKEGVLPEVIGCLSSLKELNLQGNNFEYLPRSIAQLGSLRSLDLSECKRLKEFLGVNVAEGLPSLENLNLSYCNIIDGGLLEDIGCLSSLKELNLQGNNFEHLPRSIAQLGALQTLHLTDCHMALKNIPNLPQRVIFTPLPYGSEKYNDLIPITFARAMFQNISDSHSLSLRMFTIEHAGNKIPSWFHHRGTDQSVSVNLPENWYTCDNFLGFVVCYYDRLVEPQLT